MFIMAIITEKIWRETTHFGSLWFYSFLIIFVFILGEKVLSFQLLGGIIISYVITLIIRGIYYRDRPVKQTHHNFLEKFDASSFPSLHSMRGAILFTLFSFYYKTLPIALLFLVLAITIFASRYFLKKHYISDIAAGALIGFLLAYGIILV